jgi:hypothetical protein
MAPIKLVCEGCKRSMEYDRSIDTDIPPEVVKITQPHCDQCWDGDREGETWYDAKGCEVSQEPPEADIIRTYDPTTPYVDRLRRT